MTRSNEQATRAAAGTPAGYRDGVYGDEPAGYGAPVDAVSGQVATASGLNLLLGVWLVVAPWVLDYADVTAAGWNQVTIGIVVAVLALARVAAPYRFASLSWVNAVLGAWLVVAPFLLPYEGGGSAPAAVLWNDIVVGLAILALGVWSAVATQRSDAGRQL